MKYFCRTRGRHRVPLSLPLAFGTMILAAIASTSHAQAFTDTVASDAGPLLPDAPSAVLLSRTDDAGQRMRNTPPMPPPCPVAPPPKLAAIPDAPPPAAPPCVVENPLRIVVNFENQQPLTARQKASLAGRDVLSPFNIMVIVAQAGIGVGANSHSPYGPGLKGFGRLTGYQLLQATQGEFFGTFLIPSLVHEDPRYRRMQHASVKRRILHALERTVVAQHDDGRLMPNYATLLTYPISAELSNLYVPGVQGNGPSTARRIGIGLATDPISNLIAEFLPDIATRIHVRNVFIQQIVNNMALNPVTGAGP